MNVGRSPSRILLGTMLTSYLIAMWISNNATVMILLSAVLAVIVQIEKHFKEELHPHKIASALLIGLAYSAIIGGMATIVGTPTNMIFLREYTEKFPLNNDMNFLSWLLLAFPLLFVFLLVAFGVLKTMFIKKDSVLLLDTGHFSSVYQKLGKDEF